MKQLSKGEDIVIRAYVNDGHEDEFEIIDSTDSEFGKLIPFSPKGTSQVTVFDRSAYYVLFGDIAYKVPKKKYDKITKHC